MPWRRTTATSGWAGRAAMQQSRSGRCMLSPTHLRKHITCSFISWNRNTYTDAHKSIKARTLDEQAWVCPNQPAADWLAEMHTPHRWLYLEQHTHTHIHTSLYKLTQTHTTYQDRMCTRWCICLFASYVFPFHFNTYYIRQSLSSIRGYRSFHLLSRTSHMCSVKICDLKTDPH